MATVVSGDDQRVLNCLDKHKDTGLAENGQNQR